MVLWIQTISLQQVIGLASKFNGKAFLARCTRKPGVYRFYNAQEKILYVGKARNLHDRLSSYFASQVNSRKTAAMLNHVADVQVTVTNDETEALLLEQALIKKYRPPYNILLRDDKSYPYIVIDTSHEFPRAGFHRGKRTKDALYFGPYPNVASVKEALNVLEKVFKLRNCHDTMFKQRTRPCLQYQINRCTAPCVGKVSQAQYAEQVQMAVDFLEGRDSKVLSSLQEQMLEAAEQLEFEKAADFRDQISLLRLIQQKQHVDTANATANVDIFALLSRHGYAVIEELTVRNGRLLGHKSHSITLQLDQAPAEIMETFVAQYYLNQSDSSLLPKEIITNYPLRQEHLAEALLQHSGRRMHFSHNVRGQRLAWLRLAEDNAKNSMVALLANQQNIQDRLQSLQENLSLSVLPERIECFDISHTGGEKAVAACVVFGTEGPMKQQYRRYNVSPKVAGDDYAAMSEAVQRRYRRTLQSDQPMPDLLLIDGGKGQVSAVATILAELGLPDIEIIGISQAPGKRKNTEERLHKTDGSVVVLPPDNRGLHLLQQVRDEAHRFALIGHRARRKKTRTSSSLEGIPGVGAKRRKALLHHFGGLAQLRNASEEAIAAVDGIGPQLAHTVYSWLHE